MMKPICLYSILCGIVILLTTSISAQVIEDQSIESEILGKAVEYSIYLPPGYEEDMRSYPIVYLLHGYTDDETAWVQFGEIDRLADEAIEDGYIPPMIIAMPDAGVSWYINNYDGSVRYEDFFFEEFLPHIEEAYRVRSEKQFRGVCGLSMGGYGALIYGMKHPDMFVASAPLSAGIYTEATVIGHEQDRWERIESVLYGPGLEGEQRITSHWKSNNPFYLADELGVESLSQVRYYFDCGDDDFLFDGNLRFMLTLRKMEVPFEFRMRDGAHNWTYWRSGVIDALHVIGTSFHR